MSSTPERAGSTAEVSGRKRNAERSRRKILDAAEKMFAERGYLAVTLDDIARRSGTKRSLILYHFKSKLGLWRTASERAANAFTDALNGKLVNTGPGDAGYDRPAAVAAWFDAYMEHPHFPKMLVMEGNSHGQRLDWLIEHVVFTRKAGSPSLLNKERVSHALLRDVLMAIILAMSALGPLMEASMARVSGKRTAGLHPMTSERRSELIEILTRIIETFEK